MQCLSRRGKCRACEVWVPCAVLVVCSAVQYVGTTDPTVLPIRKMPLVLVYDPLDNHEIAFGVVHFALRRFPRWCARRWGRYCPPMHGRVGGTLSHPRSARAVSFGVSLRIHSHLCGLWSRAEYRPSPYPRTSAASAQSRLSQRLRPRADAPRPPALVVDPVLCENRRKPYRLHRLGAMFGFQALPCAKKT